MPPESPALFDIVTAPEDAALVLVPVPFDATASYERGTHKGPRAIREASDQIDLCDPHFESFIHRGVAMLPIPEDILARNARLSLLCDQLRERPDPVILEEVNQGGEALNQWVTQAVTHWRGKGKLVGVVGGDHSTPFGAIAAHAEACPELGVLHIDAHHDLRDAYEGFHWSHASIMHNVLERTSVTALVQVGIRDYCEEERARASEDPRIFPFYDQALADARFCGATFESQCDEILAPLPEDVYVSLDIDGLSPDLCPHTGTPVPGGLSFTEFGFLLHRLVRSGRRVHGFDLSEVAPGKDTEWDANVGMRVLYKLCGAALTSR